jgi:hypothetical protein
MSLNKRLIRTNDTTPSGLDVTSFTLDATRTGNITGLTGNAGFSFNDDGSKMWICEVAFNNNFINEYNLSTAFSPATYSFVSKISISSINYGQFTFHIGNYVYAGGYNNGGSAATMYRFELNAGSIVGSTQTSGAGIANFTESFNLNPTGDKFVVNNAANGAIQSIFSLSTPFDIQSTKTLLGTVDLSAYLQAGTDHIQGQFTIDGTQFVCTITDNGFPGSEAYIGVIECSTPFDLTTHNSLSSVTVNLDASVNQPYGAFARPDNLEVYSYNQFAADFYVFN